MESNKSHLGALVAKVVTHVLGCINKTVASGTREKINYLSLALMRLCLEYCVQFCTRKSWPAGIHLAKGHQACLGAGEHDIWGEIEETGFVQSGEEKPWWGIRLLPSPVSWRDFGMLNTQFSGYQSSLYCRSCTPMFKHCLLVDTETHGIHTSGLRQNWGGKNSCYMSITVCRILPLGSHCTAPPDRSWQSIFTYGEDECMISVPLCQRQETGMFFQYLIQPFEDNSVNIDVWRFHTSFIISYVYSQAGLTELKLCWVGALGMKWYEVLLCSCPSFTRSWGIFPLRRDWRAMAQPEAKTQRNPGQTSQMVSPYGSVEHRVNLPAWAVRLVVRSVQQGQSTCWHS